MTEAFFGWYSQNEYEEYMIMNRMTGPYGPIYWALIFCNGLIPQMLWSRSVRRNVIVVFVISLIVNVGMWLERFVIVVTSLHRDFLPSSWDMYYPTKWDWIIYLGSIGQFLVLFFLFLRFVPMIAMFEMKHLTPESEQNKA
jgi:molybdopterin-containing oxidoreductase family membrane subunit